MSLVCSQAGCGEDAETVFRGFAYCGDCLELSYEVPRVASPDEMDDVVADCRELYEAFPDLWIPASEIFEMRQRLGREAMTHWYDLAEKGGVRRREMGALGIE